jgi:hypothetical protein
MNPREGFCARNLEDGTEEFAATANLSLEELKTRKALLDVEL